jgi:CubicO group peptidase (beta-lactamase class C family)
MILRCVYLAAFVFFVLSGKAQLKTLNGMDISPATVDRFLQQQMDSLGIPGLSIAIINDGKIVYHRALGRVSVDSRQPVDDSSIFEAASLSKPLFAYFVMKMVDKSLLSLDTPLYKYMPYTDIERDERYKLITARLVLSHQTGFPNWRYFNKADSSLHVKDGDLYIKFTPGSQFSYSGEGYLYLAKVIAFLEHRTLQTLEPLFQQEVDRPLGIEHAWYTGNGFITRHKVSGHENGKVFGHAEGGLWGHDERSNGYSWPTVFPGWDSSWFNPAAGLHTEAVSYAHFLIGLMLGKGLSKKSLEEMLTPQVMLPKDNILYKLYQDPAWGLGIAITPTPYGTRYDHAGSNGNFESHAVFYKNRKYGYVFFVNCNKGDDFYKRLGAFLTTGK